MKWVGMYFLGFILLIGGVLAALWKLGIMVSVANAGTKQNIEIDRE
jgi:hypothetical protein